MCLGIYLSVFLNPDLDIYLYPFFPIYNFCSFIIIALMLNTLFEKILDNSSRRKLTSQHIKLAYRLGLYTWLGIYPLSYLPYDSDWQPVGQFFIVSSVFTMNAFSILIASRSGPAIQKSLSNNCCCIPPPAPEILRAYSKKIGGPRIRLQTADNEGQAGITEKAPPGEEILESAFQSILPRDISISGSGKFEHADRRAPLLGRTRVASDAANFDEDDKYLG
jgi:hypothetical protein